MAYSSMLKFVGFTVYIISWLLRLSEEAGLPQVKVAKKIYTVKEKEKVVLSCKFVSKTPVKNIKWVKNGVTVQSSVSKTDLVFNSVLAQDAGKYTCNVKNSQGVGKSPNVTLNVLYAPRNTHSEPPSPVLMTQNDSRVIECKTDAYPPASLTWYKDEKVYKENDKMIVIKPSMYERHKFRCVAENEYGTDDYELSVGVTYSPQNTIIHKLPVAAIPEGDDILMDCTSDSFPHPTLTWYRFKREIYVGSSLSVRNVTSLDAGEYECVAENNVGKESAKINVTVLYSPKNTTIQPSEYIVMKKGETKTFICTTDAVPTASVYWYRTGEVLGNTANITIQFAEIKDKGLLTCFANNSQGYAEIDLIVMVSGNQLLKKSKMSFGLSKTLIIALCIIASLYIMQYLFVRKK